MLLLAFSITLHISYVGGGGSTTLQNLNFCYDNRYLVQRINVKSVSEVRGCCLYRQIGLGNFKFTVWLQLAISLILILKYFI